MKLFLATICLMYGMTVYAQDTINRNDPASRKFGHWRIYGNDKSWQGKGYADASVVEEGRYFQGKKCGVWKMYYPSGKLKSEIEFENGRPSGIFKTWFGSGCIEEEGTWKNNAYNGYFRRYYENGVIAKEMTYNDAGKTEGKVIYRYINGKTKLEFNSVSGKESGLMVSYYPNGDKKEEVIIVDGKPDESTRKTYEVKNPEVDLSAFEGVDCKGNPVIKADKPSNGRVIDGYEGIYNEDKKLVQEGEFKNGKLYNGKWYFYDENGHVIKVEIWKNGKYFADGQLD